MGRIRRGGKNGGDKGTSGISRLLGAAKLQSALGADKFGDLTLRHCLLPFHPGFHPLSNLSLVHTGDYSLIAVFVASVDEA